MRDTQLYQQVLGLSAPWRVSRVELKIKEHQVDIWVEYRSCGYDGARGVINGQCRHERGRVWAGCV